MGSSSGAMTRGGPPACNPVGRSDNRCFVGKVLSKSGIGPPAGETLGPGRPHPFAWARAPGMGSTPAEARPCEPEGAQETRQEVWGWVKGKN